MLRLTSENHMRLSEMADNKANILISVNAIIISVILTVLIRKIEVDRHLTIPTMIFLATGIDNDCHIHPGYKTQDYQRKFYAGRCNEPQNKPSFFWKLF
jgi:hypothetical protein